MKNFYKKTKEKKQKFMVKHDRNHLEKFQQLLGRTFGKVPSCEELVIFFSTKLEMKWIKMLITSETKAFYE